MPNLATQKPTSIHRAIIFGPPKAGKTLLAGSLAEAFNLHWFDVENGHETLFQLPVEWQKRITLYALPDTRSFPIGIETCKKVVKATGPISICELHGKVSCQLCKKAEAAAQTFDPTALTSKDVVVFDSATQLTASAIAHLTKSKPEEYKMQTDDWSNLGKQMDIFFSHVQQAKYHIVVISHDIDAKLEEKGKTQLVPVAGSRNFSRNVAKFFDHVIYAQRKNRKHVFSSSTVSSNAILTGSRSNVDMEATESASLVPIFQSVITSKAVGSTTTEVTKAKSVLSSLKNRQENK